MKPSDQKFEEFLKKYNIVDRIKNSVELKIIKLAFFTGYLLGNKEATNANSK